MCLTLPAKVLSVSGVSAKLEVSGREKEVKMLTPEDLQIGDWVLFTNDFLLKKISASEAEEIFALLKAYPLAEPSQNQELKNILAKAKSDKLQQADIEYLLTLKSEADLNELYSEANITRKTSIKDHICVHGLIEFSNYCASNCQYCGIRCGNQAVKRYRMTSEEIIEAVREAVEDKGYKILVLQSGEDYTYSDADLISLVTEIKKRFRAFLYLSIGGRSLEVYQQLKKAGANGVLIRYEEMNDRLYTDLHQGEDGADRRALIDGCLKLGYTIATGFIAGLPKQSVTDLAVDILTLKRFNAFMPSFGPLVPSKNTPLVDEIILPEEMMLKIIATIRLVLPKARIPVTTAMETLYGEQFRHKAFMAGANAIMLNLTPEKYRADYEIYENKFYDQEKKMEKWALFKGDLSYEMLEEELKVKI